MRTRPTVRVLLLDPLDRVLLIHCEDPRVVDPVLPADRQISRFWVLPGGGIEGDESLEAAALRELVEEVGLTDIALGQPVLHREKTMHVDGETIHFVETYLIGRTRVTNVSWIGAEALEMETFRDLRWWTLADLRATEETVFPEGLADLMATVTGAVESA